VDARPNRPDHVYLSDFGVSKRAAASVQTGTGQYLGTVYYSAPEQIRGRAVDGRADQYALGCVTYQLLTGQVPFERDEDVAVMFAHVSEPPPSLGARWPGLAGAVDEVLARALAKAPDDRYSSCEDFADALREALGLAPYTSPDLAAATGHPQAEISSPPPEFPGPDRSRAGSAAVPADVAAASTIDGGPGGSSAGAADPPAEALTVTGAGAETPTATAVARQGLPPAVTDVQAADHPVRYEPGPGGDGAQMPHRLPRRPGTAPVWIRRPRGLAITLAGVIAAGAAVVAAVLASAPSPSSSSHPASPGRTSPITSAAAATHSTELIVGVSQVGDLSVTAPPVPLKILKGPALTVVLSRSLADALAGVRGLTTNVPVGAYQVCADPPHGWTFLGPTTGVLPGWDCIKVEANSPTQTVTFSLTPD
jgi:hypothetical protein